MRVSAEGLAMIKAFEGLTLEARRLPDGRYIIGHGHVETAREGARLSPEQAEALLIWDLKPIEDTLKTRVFSPLTQQQFDALASFALNIGLARFLESDVLRALNAGRPIEAAMALDGWRLARTEEGLLTVDALVRRRTAEKALFLSESASISAPAARLQPEFDLRAALEDLAAEIAGNADHVAPEAPLPPTPLDRAADAIAAQIERVGTRRDTPAGDETGPGPGAAAPREPAPAPVVDSPGPGAARSPFAESIETDLSAGFALTRETRTAMGGLGFYGALGVVGAVLAGAGLFDAYRLQDAAAPIERAAVGPLLAAAGVVILIGAAWHIFRTLDGREGR